jgi:hypothetical protein
MGIGSLPYAVIRDAFHDFSRQASEVNVEVMDESVLYT